MYTLITVNFCVAIHFEILKESKKKNMFENHYPKP